MSESEIYRFIGLAVVIIFVLAICAKVFRYQTRVIEGMSASMTDKDKVADVVNQNTDVVDDKLLVAKYRTSYEDTIVALERNCSEHLLSKIVDNAESISKNPTSEVNHKLITSLNALSDFRGTLNTAMIILDKKK